MLHVPGGKQPTVCDTVWKNEVQYMVLHDCRAKGMKIVQQEIGVGAHRLCHVFRLLKFFLLKNVCLHVHLY